MSTAATPAFGPGPGDARGLNRAITWSIAVHVLAIAALALVPRDWLSRPREQPTLMTISLGGALSQATTGTTSVGGRTVEQVAPPPRRPEPIRPATPDEPAPIPVKPQPPRPAPAPRPAARQAPEVTRPVVTGPVVAAGSTRVETGARGQGAGLSFDPGSGAGGDTDLRDFCCPEFLQHLLATVSANWRKDQPQQGLAVLKFVIQKNGTVTGLVVEATSGSSVLDRLARNAVLDSRFLPLPAEYPRDTLTIHLRFPYAGSPR